MKDETLFTKEEIEYIGAIKNTSVEFADWINSNEYIKTANNESKWIYWAADEEFNTKYTTEELFEEFIKERNK